MEAKFSLTPADIQIAADSLGVEVAALRAVMEVESRGEGFLPDGRPVILFEALWFSKLTKGIYDKKYPNLSSPRWNKRLYGPAGVHQWDRLNRAIKLAPTPALKSASFGIFQIMGFNHKACGYSTVEEFLKAMSEDAFRQLVAFSRFLVSKKLDVPLRNRDWAKFACGYNGEEYAKNRYHKKLADAYEKFAKDPVAG
jgi:hypothetical protein